MHKDKLIATIQIKSLKIQSYVPTILVLSILWDESPVNVKKVVTELALDTGTVSPLLKRMEQVDLIKRERSEVDQREVFIHLTEKSEKFKPELSDASQKSRMLLL